MMKLKAFVKAEQSKIEDSAKKWVEKEPVAKWLEIEEYIVNEKIEGFYLLYYDDNGKSYCDDFYLTLKDAINNAYWACRVEPEDWHVVKPEDWEAIVDIGKTS
jgi:hypothetical protein